MLARIKETDLSVPFRDRRYLWYSRTEEGKQYPIHCRKRDIEAAGEEVAPRPQRARGGAAVHGSRRTCSSPDGRLLAYSTDNTGFRQYTLHIKDLDTGDVLADRIERAGRLAWAADGQTLFYTVEDDDQAAVPALPPSRSATTDDDLVYEERTSCSTSTSIARAATPTCSCPSAATRRPKCGCLPADEPSGEWRVVAPREHEHEYDVEHHGDWLLHPHQRRRTQLPAGARARGSPPREPLAGIVPHRADVMLEDIELFERHHVLLRARDGLPQLRVTDLRDGRVRTASSSPSRSTRCRREPNREFDADDVPLSATSRW